MKQDQVHEQTVKAFLFTNPAKYDIVITGQIKTNFGLILKTNQSMLEEYMPGIEKYTKSGHSSIVIGGRTRQTFLYASIAVLLIAVIVLAILYGQAAGYRRAMEMQFQRRINSAVIDAIEQANRLTGSVQANSASRLALVRQYVHSIDQYNQISVMVNGEAGRLVPQEAMTALYNDLDTYDKLVQTATSSTLEIRTRLTLHLTALQQSLAF